jgi:hypothetical protein
MLEKPNVKHKWRARMPRDQRNAENIDAGSSTSCAGKDACGTTPVDARGKSPPRSGSNCAQRKSLLLYARHRFAPDDRRDPDAVAGSAVHLDYRPLPVAPDPAGTGTLSPGWV